MLQHSEQSFSFQDPDGRKISAVLLSPASKTKKIVVLCHGFMGFKDSWTNRALSEQLSRQGIATLRFDFFGHGQSDGDLKDLLLSTLVRQTRCALALMRGHGYTHRALLGSSFGGLVATLAAAEEPTLAALALRCPVGDFPALLRQRFGRMAIELWRRLGRVPQSIAPIPVDFRFYEDCLKHEAGRAARAIRVPTIIVHGEQDDLIPVAQAQDLYAGLAAQKALHVIPGADHRFSRPNHFTHMTDLLVNWLVRYLSLPAPTKS